MQNQKGIVQLLVLIILLVGIAIGVYLSQHPQIFKPKASEQPSYAREIAELTNKLLNENRRILRPGDKSPKPRSITELKGIALKRKNLMLMEIDNNPGSAVKLAISEQDRQGLPEEIKEFIEQKKDLIGNFKTVHLDFFKEDKSKEDYLLEEIDSSVVISKNKKGKKLYTLHFSDKAPNILGGSSVKVKGIALDQKIVLPNQQLTESELGIQVLAASTEAPTIGERKVVVLLLKFADDDSQPISPEQAKQIVLTSNTSVNAFFKESSFDKLSLSGDVFGWYKLSQTSSYCPSGSGQIYSWSYEADQLASSNGINLANYQNIVYVFSKRNSCDPGILGRGELGGYTPRAWIEDWVNDVRLYAHEMGHNLGLHHASTLNCYPEVVKTYTTCSRSEYGDQSDVMGSAFIAPVPFQFNSAHKYGLNWLSPQNVVNITSNSYQNIYPLENISSYPQIIRIPKNDTGDYYYISYRQPLGFDSQLNLGITRGVSIHIWKGTIWDQTLMLDPTPHITFSEPTLSDGAIFYDKQNKISLKQDFHSSSQASLFIKLNDSGLGMSINPQSVDISLLAGTSAKAFDLTSTTASAFSLYGYPTNYGAGINWSSSSGGISSNFTMPININVSSNVPPGIYTGTGKLTNPDSFQELTFPVKVTVLPRSTPTPTPTPTPDPNSDADGDGFKYSEEIAIGTNPDKACPENKSDNAWPPDVNNDGVVNGGDVSTLVPFINGSKPFDKRYDLNLDSKIDLADVEVIKKYFLTTCPK